MCARSRVWDVPIQIRENLINLMGKYRQKKIDDSSNSIFENLEDFFDSKLQFSRFVHAKIFITSSQINFITRRFFCLYFCLKTTSFQGISITPPELRDLAHTTLLHKVTCFFLDLASEAFRVLAVVEHPRINRAIDTGWS